MSHLHLNCNSFVKSFRFDASSVSEPSSFECDSQWRVKLYTENVTFPVSLLAYEDSFFTESQIGH